MAKRRKSKTETGKKKTIKNKCCFVIMPFGGWLDDYYDDIYRPAISSAGFTPHRADDLFRPSAIINDIWNYTKEAKIVVADLTGKNPNVFYELGLAHALAKPVVLLAESMDDVPFDLRSLRVIVYDKNEPDWGQLLKTKLKTAIKEIIESPREAVLPTFLSSKDAIKPKKGTVKDERELLELKREVNTLRGRLLTVDDEMPRISKDRRIGPMEAEKLIRDLLIRKFSSQYVQRRLEAHGAPPRLD